MNYQIARVAKQLCLDNENLVKKITELEARPSSQKLTAENKKLKNQELRGARCTIDHQIDKDLQAEIGVQECENDNIQLVVCRLASFCQNVYDEIEYLQNKILWYENVIGRKQNE